MAYAWVAGCISIPAVENSIAQQVQQLSQPVLQTQAAPF